MRPLRVFATGFVLHFKNLSASPFMVMTAAIWPLVYATLAFLMFRATHQAPSLLYAALGAAVMGIWSTTATSAGGAVQQQRNWKVLELLVGAPSPLILVLAPITVAIAGIGVYSIVTTLIWGRLLFGVPFHVLHPVLFLISIPAAVLSIGLLGLVLASTLVLYREASAFSQMLEYPVWLITGMLIPLSLLPGWVHPISWVLAPTWGMRAVRRAALGGSVGPPLLACLLLTIAYTVLAVVLLNHFERLARERATLSLSCRRGSASSSSAERSASARSSRGSAPGSTSRRSSSVRPHRSSSSHSSDAPRTSRTTRGSWSGTQSSRRPSRPSSEWGSRSTVSAGCRRSPRCWRHPRTARPSSSDVRCPFS